MMSSGSITTTHRHRVAEAERLPLAHVVQVGQVGQAADRVERLDLARRRQLGLELGVAVEVVADRPLAPAGDDQDVGDATGHGFLDHVLDRRLVEDGQHLLGLRLRRREEAGAEAGRRDDGLAHGARTHEGAAPVWASAVTTRFLPAALAA
jgi:hypothetical protein